MSSRGKMFLCASGCKTIWFSREQRDKHERQCWFTPRHESDESGDNEEDDNCEIDLDHVVTEQHAEITPAPPKQRMVRMRNTTAEREAAWRKLVVVSVQDALLELGEQVQKMRRDVNRLERHELKRHRLDKQEAKRIDSHDREYARGGTIS